MGGGNSKLSKTEEKLVDQKKYTREPIIENDVRYGQRVQVYREVNSASRVAIIQKVFDNEIAFDATIEIQKLIAKVKHPCLVQLLNVATKRKDKLCSRFYKIKFLYDYVQDDLKNEMERRLACESELKAIPSSQLATSDISEFYQPNTTNIRIHYDESEIWYIAVTTLAVLAYLAQRKLVHGDIRPYNLCLTSDSVLKVMAINSQIQTNWSSYLEKIENIPTQSTYISPIQLGALQHKVQQPHQNIPKSDVFCLGIILLECCLLESAQDVYDFTTFSINLVPRIAQLKSLQKYSDIFIETLIKMLTLDESKRPTPENLFDSIANYASQQQIAISKSLFTLEKAQNILLKWKSKYRIQQPGLDPLTGQPQITKHFTGNAYSNMDANHPKLPNKLFDNNANPLDPLQIGINPIDNARQMTEEAFPNQENGEIVNEMGLLRIMDPNDELNSSFSIKKSGHSLSPFEKRSQDIENHPHKNTPPATGSFHDLVVNQNEISRIKRELVGDSNQKDENPATSNQNQNNIFIQDPIENKENNNSLITFKKNQSIVPVSMGRTVSQNQSAIPTRSVSQHSIATTTPQQQQGMKFPVQNGFQPNPQFQNTASSSSGFFANNNQNQLNTMLNNQLQAQLQLQQQLIQQQQLNQLQGQLPQQLNWNNIQAAGLMNDPVFLQKFQQLQLMMNFRAQQQQLMGNPWQQQQFNPSGMGGGGGLDSFGQQGFGGIGNGMGNTMNLGQMMQNGNGVAGGLSNPFLGQQQFTTSQTGFFPPAGAAQGGVGSLFGGNPLHNQQQSFGLFGQNANQNTGMSGSASATGLGTGLGGQNLFGQAQGGQNALTSGVFGGQNAFAAGTNPQNATNILSQNNSALIGGNAATGAAGTTLPAGTAANQGTFFGQNPVNQAPPKVDIFANSSLNLARQKTNLAQNNPAQGQAAGAGFAAGTGTTNTGNNGIFPQRNRSGIF